MTMPEERRRSIGYAREFLRDLLDPKKTPRVPKAVRQEALRVLRHFPTELDIKLLKEECPKLLGDWGEY